SIRTNTFTKGVLERKPPRKGVLVSLSRRSIRTNTSTKGELERKPP
ncbi:15985_t:CDS:1, partial [Funneliformis caledonium]